MAKKQSGEDRTPSADEIIEALSLEMGVTEDDEASSEPADDKAAAAEDAAREAVAEAAAVAAAAVKSEATTKKDAAHSDAMSAMGGIFDVPSGGSGKKGKGKGKGGKDSAAEAPAPAPEASKASGKKAEPAEKAASPAAKSASKKSEESKAADAKANSSSHDAIDGLFDVGPASKRKGEDDPLTADLDDHDADKFDDPPRKGNGLLIGVIVILVLALGVTVVVMGGYGDDIMAVFSGNYRDKKDAEKRRVEEEWRKEQLEKLEKYGNLNITGTSHALFKIKLEGFAEPRPLFGNIEGSNVYRPLRLPVIVQNLKIKQPIPIVVEAPGFQPSPMTLTKDMWQEGAIGEYLYQTNLTLQPASPWHQTELNDRMLDFAEEESPPAGVITVESVPAGAKIMINKRQIVDKDGKPVLTPATVSMLPPKPAEEGDKKKNEPKPLDINTPPDVGYRVDVYFDDPNEPAFVDVVQRSQWICNPKDDKEVAKLPKDARPALKCNYAATVVADFNAIKAEIIRQKAIEEELRKQAEDKAQIEEDSKKQSE